jgi:hypothetical protein
VAEWADGLEHECSDEVLDDEHDLVVVAASAMDMVVGFFFYIFSILFAKCPFNTPQTRCRVLKKKHLTKSVFPTNFLCVFCRMLHSATSLPSVFGPRRAP